MNRETEVTVLRTKSVGQRPDGLIFYSQVRTKFFLDLQYLYASALLELIPIQVTLCKIVCTVKDSRIKISPIPAHISFEQTENSSAKEKGNNKSWECVYVMTTLEMLTIQFT